PGRAGRCRGGQEEGRDLPVRQGQPGQAAGRLDGGEDRQGRGQRLEGGGRRLDAVEIWLCPGADRRGAVGAVRPVGPRRGRREGRRADRPPRGGQGREGPGRRRRVALRRCQQLLRLPLQPAGGQLQALQGRGRQADAAGDEGGAEVEGGHLAHPE